MSDFVSFNVDACISHLTIKAIVSIDTPIIKRLLICEIAEALESANEFESTKEEFFASISEQIAADGTNSFRQLKSPDFTKIKGGLDNLLQETNSFWKRLFGDSCDSNYKFSIIISLVPDDIIRAYACALNMGLVDTTEDPPETSGAYRVLHYVIEARVNYGENYKDLGVEPHYSIAETTVERNFPNLLLDFTCGSGFSVELLEF